MTNSKNTKRALLASVLSIVLCVAMLVGSTFAWFTDSVTSGKNKIVAGNLDVELYAKSGDEYKPVTEDTNLFLEGALWEPGHVEVINLKLANIGTLALQYRLGINVAREKEGISVQTNETFKLSDYIKFALIDGDKDFGTDDAGRAAAIAAADANAVALSDLAVDENGVLYPAGIEGKDSERFVTLVVYMPTTVGNEANYLTGTEAPEIDLGVKLVATQTPYENDSFNDQYDKNAVYPVDKITTADELKAAMKPGATITISDNIDFAAAGYNKDNPFVIDVDGVTIDLNSKEIYTSWLGIKVTGEDVTIKNGTIKRPEGTSYTYGITLNGVNTVMENITVDSGINVSGYNVDDSVKPGVSAKIENCNIILDCDQAYYAVCAQGEAHTIVENVEINRTNPGKANYYFWVENEFTDEMGYVGDSYIGYNYVTMNSTCNTGLYNPDGLEPVDLSFDDNDIEDPFGD